MAQMSINGEDFPSSLNGRGVYMFYEPEQRIAGDGTAINAGGHSIIWRWNYVTRSEWSWIIHELFGGARFLTVTAAELLINDTKEATTTFNSGVAYLPDSRKFEFHTNAYHNVELEVRHLLPVVSYASAVWTVGTSTVGGAHVISYT